MIRLLVAGDLEGERAALGPEAAHYLGRVLRLAPGAEIEAFDGRGLRRRARLTRLSDDGGELELGERLAEAARRLEISLWQGLAKGEKLDWVVQKATELGVSEIVPFASARSVVRLPIERAQGRVARWRKIAEEAARQSNRTDVPRVTPPATLEELARRCAGGSPVVALHPGAPLPFGEALARSRGSGSLALAVGPEGGFEPAELSALEGAGALLASLGALVLRTETAGLVACALAAFAAGDLG